MNPSRTVNSSDSLSLSSTGNITECQKFNSCQELFQNCIQRRVTKVSSIFSMHVFLYCIIGMFHLQVDSLVQVWIHPSSHVML